ncbi:hypothetical protein FB45DRAFT_1032322 [Roridomyces roridus]|uniref:Microbial-type PARG catalytic domain-containing protein n=1 Tax=Roridomyces roridus TaxID=1738132 RepID=A0AAD7BHE7_9AGAR|nr:hypothetical protein FB45DRAFT_1032322 [Roridomyces roridus]
MAKTSWLKKLAKDTISRSAGIVAEHAAQGATTDSVLVKDQLPQLDQAACPNHSPSAVEIVNLDAFSLARRVLAGEPRACWAEETGPWLQVYTKTQEEALCYSSTLYVTLKPEYYPWPNYGPGCVAGIYSPGVVIFRDDLDHRCEELSLEDRRVVSVLTVAAPAWADLTEDETTFADPQVLGWLREKIRLVYRMAAHNGQDHLVLGAMGCGAYECPPELVAREMRDILREAEFEGWFKKVVFAVYSTAENGEGNFGIFRDVFGQV